MTSGLTFAVCPKNEKLREGEKTNFSTVAALLARTLCAQGHYSEAEHHTKVSQEAARPNDVLSQIFWRSARARVHAHRGEREAAERLAREAVGFAEESDFLNSHGDALMDLAEVLALADKTKEASDALEQALTLYERKGNIVMAERVRARLVELPSVTSN